MQCGNEGEETYGKVWKSSGAAGEAEDEGLEGETRTRDEDDGHETRARDENENESAG